MSTEGVSTFPRLLRTTCVRPSAQDDVGPPLRRAGAKHAKALQPDGQVHGTRAIRLPITAFDVFHDGEISMQADVEKRGVERVAIARHAIRQPDRPDGLAAAP